jgi:hypothetical protein
MTVLWNVPPCRLVDIEGRFKGSYCAHHQGDDCQDGLIILSMYLDLVYRKLVSWSWICCVRPRHIYLDVPVECAGDVP